MILKDSIYLNLDKVNNSSLVDSLKITLIDKTLKFNRKIKIDSTRLTNYFKISDNYYNLKQYKAFKDVSNTIISESYFIKDTAKINLGYINLGDYYLKINKYDSAFYYFDKAEVNYIRNNLYEKANKIKLRKAIIQYHKCDYLGCEKSIFLTLPFYKKDNNIAQLNIAYTLLGLSKIETKEYDESLEFLNLARKYSKGIDKKTGITLAAINNLGLLYLKKGDYSEAIDSYNQLNNDEIKKKFLDIYTYTKQNLTYSKFKLGELKDFEENYQEVLENYKLLKITQVLPQVQLSEFYESQNQLLKAQEFALAAYNTSLKENAYRDRLLALKQLTNVFPEKAKFYSTEYIKLSDSIAAVDKKTQNTFARIEYRVDELSNENLILEERNKQIIYYSIIGILLLSLFYFYKWQKQKQLELLLIQEQQLANEQVYNLMINQQVQMDEIKMKEQKRISQELHDGVLGKLFGARMNLDIMNAKIDDGLKEQKKKYIKEIIEVESQIRQVSHELNDETRKIINNFQLLLDRFVEDQEILLKINIEYILNNKVPWEKTSGQEKINIYRIIQESFQNINKYAFAKNITFSISYENNKLKINILDDGIGFNVKKITDKKGIGIKNMKERAKLINATYKIESELYKGTKTQIILEINPNKEF